MRWKLSIFGKSGEFEDLQRVAGYFDKSETELFTEIRRGKTQKITAKPRQPSFSDVPIAVLVDSESASASELLARHLQLSGRAVIIGTELPERWRGHESLNALSVLKLPCSTALRRPSHMQCFRTARTSRKPVSRRT